MMKIANDLMRVPARAVRYCPDDNIFPDPIQRFTHAHARTNLRSGQAGSSSDSEQGTLRIYLWQWTSSLHLVKRVDVCTYGFLYSAGPVARPGDGPGTSKKPKVQ